MENKQNTLTQKRLAALGAAIIILLLSGFNMGRLKGGISVTVDAPAASVASAPAGGQSSAPQSVTPQEQPAPSEDAGEESAKPSEEEKPEENKNEGAKEMTTEEIVELFNESANKIKTEAVKVVKNYEKRIVNKDKLVVPSILQGMAETLMDKYMTDDTEPIEYNTREEIVSEYIVPGQEYVSCLTAADVAEASCTDTGTEYEIYIKLKDETNPTSGKGVGAACDVIEASEINVSFVESFTTEYYDCVIKATIDKETGKMTHSNYIAPLVLAVRVNMFGTHDAAVGLAFEKDYTITY